VYIKAVDVLISVLLLQLLRSYRLKQLCFFLIICSTAGLLYAFLRHRWFCEPGGLW